MIFESRLHIASVSMQKTPAPRSRRIEHRVIPQRQPAAHDGISALADANHPNGKAV
jgi:hypothetical protein